MSAGTAAWPHRLTLAGLTIIVALLLLPEPTAFSAMAAVPLAILVAAGIRPAAKWGGWVAVLIVPYFAGALGEAIASPDSRAEGWAITALSIVVFFAALDYTRRRGISLRR